MPQIVLYLYYPMLYRFLWRLWRCMFYVVQVCTCLASHHRIQKNRETRNVVFPHQIHYLVSFFFFLLLEMVRKNSIIPHWIFLQENTIY